MKYLADLTEEIKAKIPTYISRAKDDLYSGVEAANWKKEYTVDYINKVYEMSGLRSPVVIVANSPKEYKKFYSILFSKRQNSAIQDIVTSILKEKIENGKCESELEIESTLRKISLKKNKIYLIKPKHDYLFITSEYARVYLMWYMFIHKELDVPFSKSEELDWLYSNINKASMSRCYFTERICLVLRMPCKIVRNEIGFHSVMEPAIQFVGGDNYYYLNGRRVPNWVFDNYNKGTLTFEMFVKESNEDIRAAIITLIKEREGNEGLMSFLKAVQVDKKSVDHSDGYTEILTLWKTTERYTFLVDSAGNTNQPYAWIEMVCPSTGQTYLIDTCPTFNDAVECAKWHRPKGVPKSVPYIWQSAN